MAISPFCQLLVGEFADHFGYLLKEAAYDIIPTFCACQLKDNL